MINSFFSKIPGETVQKCTFCPHGPHFNSSSSLDVLSAESTPIREGQGGCGKFATCTPWTLPSPPSFTLMNPWYSSACTTHCTPSSVASCIICPTSCRPLLSTPGSSCSLAVRLEWLLVCALFHAQTRFRKKKNFIAAIHLEDGQIWTAQEERQQPSLIFIKGYLVLQK
jgi:hypothetical protein